MKVILLATYVDGDGRLYLPSTTPVEINDEEAIALITQKCAKSTKPEPVVEPPTPLEEVQRKYGDAISGTERSRVCPHGCRDGKPYANSAALEAHLLNKHKDS
jgi:hypothetical protein